MKETNENTAKIYNNWHSNKEQKKKKNVKYMNSMKKQTSEAKVEIGSTENPKIF